MIRGDHEQYATLPCPFCGNPKPLVMEDGDLEGHNPATHQYAVVCSARTGGCGAMGGFSFSRTGAVTKWNTRNELETSARY